MKLLQREWREQKLLTWLSAGLWVFISAFLWSPSRDGLEAIYALAFFIPMLLVLLWRKPEFHQYGGWFSVSALAYATWSCMTSLRGDGTGFLILQLFILASWLLGSAWVLHKKVPDLNKLLQWFLWLGAATALVNIAVFYASHPLAARLEGITIARAPTLVGQVYGVVVLVGILLSWRIDCFKCALGISLVCIPALAALGLSQSRGPLLALVVVLAIGVFWLRPARKILLVQCVAALLGLVVLFLFFPLDQLLLERGASLRDQIWLDVIAQMRAEPGLFLWGIGMGEATDIMTSAGEYHHAHNAWLDIFYRTGAIGLCLAAVHLLLLLWAARRHLQLAPLVLWFVYGCACLFVDSRSLFWEIDAKWLLYWVPAALLAALMSRAATNAPLVAKSKIITG
ncbi:O-antigen ligase family protein [Cellvibrio sp. OA-2007]|uniref:O-antigen ligase family protein n=1 Tax=Cellvibrio sp. OA-2007 TaxID=529823 RepID=UPI0007826881|nr:O-antigen ligase family protein [Cellvibrio sp. OA-2007]